MGNLEERTHKSVHFKSCSNRPFASCFLSRCQSESLCATMKNEKWKKEKWKMQKEKWKRKNEKWKRKNENALHPQVNFHANQTDFHVFSSFVWTETRFETLVLKFLSNALLFSGWTYQSVLTDQIYNIIAWQTSEDDFRSGCRNVSHQQQSYPHPDDHTIRTTDTSVFKQFTTVMHIKLREKRKRIEASE